MASYKYHTTSQKSLSRDNGPLAQPQVVKKFTVIYIFIAQQPFFYLRCNNRSKRVEGTTNNTFHNIGQCHTIILPSLRRRRFKNMYFSSYHLSKRLDQERMNSSPFHTIYLRIDLNLAFGGSLRWMLSLCDVDWGVFVLCTVYKMCTCGIEDNRGTNERQFQRWSPSGFSSVALYHTGLLTSFPVTSMVTLEIF